jgi:hypothetical protein
MAGETFDSYIVRAQAVDIGQGYTIAGIVLGEGETAWNPASTKGPLYGPGVVEYVMHPTGITVYEFDLDRQCCYSDSCPLPREALKTRCTLHALESYAVASS